jgi:uncharacterized cupredoxin-like copper-binding protein
MRPTRSTGRAGVRPVLAVALVSVLALVASGCSKSAKTTPTYDVFVQKFRYHNMPATIPGGNLIINFSNKESDEITHEMVVVQLPSGKTKDDIIAAAKATGDKSEDMWLHFGEVADINTGATGAGLFDLPAGTYAMACWQTGNLGGGEGDAHAARGMVWQFTVT